MIRFVVRIMCFCRTISDVFNASVRSTFLGPYLKLEWSGSGTSFSVLLMEYICSLRSMTANIFHRHHISLRNHFLLTPSPDYPFHSLKTEAPLRNTSFKSFSLPPSRSNTLPPHSTYTFSVYFSGETVFVHGGHIVPPIFHASPLYGFSPFEPLRSLLSLSFNSSYQVCWYSSI